MNTASPYGTVRKELTSQELARAINSCISDITHGNSFSTEITKASTEQLQEIANEISARYPEAEVSTDSRNEIFVSWPETTLIP